MASLEDGQYCSTMTAGPSGIVWQINKVKNGYVLNRLPISLGEVEIYIAEDKSKLLKLLDKIL